MFLKRPIITAGTIILQTPKICVSCFYLSGKISLSGLEEEEFEFDAELEAGNPSAKDEFDTNEDEAFDEKPGQFSQKLCSVLFLNLKLPMQ